MIDVGNLQGLIASLGFPIVCVLGLSVFVWKMWNTISTTNQEREDKLYEFIQTAQNTNKKLVETNAEFVQVLNTYKSDLESIKNDVTEIKERIK